MIQPDSETCEMVMYLVCEKAACLRNPMETAVVVEIVSIWINQQAAIKKKTNISYHNTLCLLVF